MRIVPPSESQACWVKASSFRLYSKLFSNSAMTMELFNNSIEVWSIYVFERQAATTQRTWH